MDELNYNDGCDNDGCVNGIPPPLSHICTDVLLVGQIASYIWHTAMGGTAIT